MTVRLERSRVEFDVVGGCCKIRFEPGMCCGPDADTNPGVSFALISDLPAHQFGAEYYSGMGVFSRNDARRLRDMLDVFLLGFDQKN